MDQHRLYWSDPYRREFSATVTAHRDGGVLLDRTAFYPTGGGQPHDTGSLFADSTEWPVTDVHGQDAIIHEVAPPLPPVGTKVHGTIDWERRLGHMRHHTAQHLLSAVLLDSFDAPTSGNQLYADRARLDCRHEPFSDETLADIEAEIQAAISADHAVKTKTMSREAAETRLDPQRSRLDLLPDSVETIRVVSIAGIDETACAGTHVKRTGEVGGFHITGRETGGKDRERIRFRLKDDS